jgi:fucose 4-O-acetylase-like acetyltransferase
MLFGIGTIIAMVIVYKNIDSSIAIKFLMGYLFFTIFSILYVFSITILNSRKLKWIDLRKRLIKFITLFILYVALLYIFDLVFRHSNIDLYKELSIAFGVAFASSFIDVMFLKKK